MLVRHGRSAHVQRGLLGLAEFHRWREAYESAVDRRGGAAAASAPASRLGQRHRRGEHRPARRALRRAARWGSRHRHVAASRRARALAAELRAPSDAVGRLGAGLRRSARRPRRIADGAAARARGSGVAHRSRQPARGAGTTGASGRLSQRSGAPPSRRLERRRPAAVESETLSGQPARTPALRAATRCRVNVKPLVLGFGSWAT